MSSDTSTQTPNDDTHTVQGQTNPEHQPTPGPTNHQNTGAAPPSPPAEPAGPAAGSTAQPDGSDSESSDEEEGPAGLRTASTLKDLGDYIWPTFRIQTDR